VLPQARCWWLTSAILAIQEAEISRIMVPSQPGQILHETLVQKYPPQKKVCRVAQVVEHLPSKLKALCSNSSTTKKKEKLSR
jgi:hypothetical protein